MIVEDIYEETIYALHRDLVIFTDRLGIMYDERPTLITSRLEMCDILISELPFEQRLSAREYLLRQLIRQDGHCFHRSKQKIIFVFVPTNRRQVQKKGYSFYLENLAHELVHYRFWTWDHNKKFHAAVNALLHTEKTWPRTRLYLDPLSDHTTPVNT